MYEADAKACLLWLILILILCYAIFVGYLELLQCACYLLENTLHVFSGSYFLQYALI